MRTFVLAALLVSVASWASAQRIGTPATHFASTAQPTTPSSSTMRRATAGSAFPPFRNFHHHASPFQSLFYPLGIFPDYSFPDNPATPSGSSPVQPDLLMRAL